MDEDVEEPFEMTLVKFEDNSRAKLPNAPKSLKRCDVRLKFQLNMY